VLRSPRETARTARRRREDFFMGDLGGARALEYPPRVSLW
jgi:hypothetical protein